MVVADPVEHELCNISLRSIPFSTEASELGKKGTTPKSSQKAVRLSGYTPGSTNIAGWNGWTRIESMYFLLNMVIFQPAMLVYQRVFFSLQYFFFW